MVLNSLKRKCLSAGFDAEYSPFFYYAVLKGKDFDINAIIAKLNEHKPLNKTECEQWSIYVHEYIHFLQDLRCGITRRHAIQTGLFLHGNIGCQLRMGVHRQRDFYEKLNVQSIELIGDDCFKAVIDNELSLDFDEVSLIEGIAVIIQDRICGIHRGYDSWPYDLAKRVVEFKLKNSGFLRDDIERITIMVAEASLMFCNPVSSFIDMVAHIADSKRIDSYSKMVSRIESMGHRLEPASDDDAFLDGMRSVYKNAIFTDMLDWLSEGVHQVSSFADQVNGLFAKLYLSNNTASQRGTICDAIFRVNHPLLAHDDALCAGVGIAQKSVRFQMALETASNIMTTSENACLMHKFCTAANDSTVNPSYQTAPNVSEWCEIDPRKICQPVGKECDFSLVWKILKGVK